MTRNKDLPVALTVNHFVTMDDFATAVGQAVNTEPNRASGRGRDAPKAPGFCGRGTGSCACHVCVAARAHTCNWRSPSVKHMPYNLDGDSVGVCS